MKEQDPETRQMRFHDGDLVEEPTGVMTEEDDNIPRPIDPGQQTGFVLEVKSGAMAVNRTLEEVIEDQGRRLDFGSRSQAEDYAHQLSATGGSLRVQAAPENDQREVDAYLLADHNPSITEPAEVDGDTLTFDVGANLYGTLGEAILLEPPKPHALHYFVQQDLESKYDLEEEPNIDVRTGGFISIADSDRAAPDRWVPDCEIIARDGWDGPVLERYYCEIKTGNASFQRSQIAAMEQLAEEERVLKIRMVIEELPDQYSLRIHEVEPPT